MKKINNYYIEKYLLGGWIVFEKFGDVYLEKYKSKTYSGAKKWATTRKVKKI